MAMGRRILCVLLVSVLGGCGGAAQQSSPVTPAPQVEPDAAAADQKSEPAAPRKVVEIEGVTEYALENGLRVLLVPDDSHDRFTVNITYFVGSRHEGYGEAGMAHLIEHMVFRRTSTRESISKELEKLGAASNGTTWLDRTNYYETLPASDETLDYVLALEADRMVNSTISAEDLSKEFSVVRNEFEANENRPMSVLMQRIQNVAFQWHNYGKDTIGNQSDIERVPAKTLRRFYQKYYQPDNAMLVVAGKFDAGRALELIRKYFGPIPRPERELDSTYTVEPVQDGEREVILRRVGDVGVVGLVYHTVPGSHPDSIAVDAALQVLTDEPSGRLYKALVEPGLAARVVGFAFPTREPGTAMLLAQVPKGKPLEPVRDKMIEIVEGLGSKSITDEETQRFIKRSKKQLELVMLDSQQTAIWLTEFAAMGDWRLLYLIRDSIEKVTNSDIQRVAATYFKRSNRTLGMYIPTDKPDRAPASTQPDVEKLVASYKSDKQFAAGEAFDASIANIEKRLQRKTLPNGLKLALLHKETRGDEVKAQITMHFASERDLKGKVTAAQFVPDMLLRGTRKHTYQQLRDELDRLKAEVSFGGGGLEMVSPGAVTVRIQTVRESLPEVIGLVAEILREPTFPADQFKIVKNEKLAALQNQLKDPTSLGFNALLRALFPYKRNDVRYVATPQEEIDDLNKLRLPAIRNFHKQFWGAEHAEMTIIGDFDAEAIAGDVEKHFGTWKAKRQFARIPIPYQQTKPAEIVINTPDKRMALIAGGRQLQIRDDDPDYPAVVMLGYIIGGHEASRIWSRLREQEGLSYGAFGNIHADALDAVGFMFFGAIIAPQNADKGMGFAIEELEKLAKDGVTEKELEAAKTSYAKSFQERLASDDFLRAALTQGLYLGRTLDWQAKRNAAIQALTPEDIGRVARKYILVDQLVKLKAGDLKKEKAE